jgi:hypothetical protein
MTIRRNGPEIVPLLQFVHPYTRHLLALPGCPDCRGRGQLADSHDGESASDCHCVEPSILTDRDSADEVAPF